MKKVFLLLLGLFIIACSTPETQYIEEDEKLKNTGLQIPEWTTSIGAVDETTEKQKLSYKYVDKTMNLK